MITREANSGLWIWELLTINLTRYIWLPILLISTNDWYRSPPQKVSLASDGIWKQATQWPPLLRAGSSEALRLALQALPFRSLPTAVPWRLDSLYCCQECKKHTGTRTEMEIRGSELRARKPAGHRTKAITTPSVERWKDRSHSRVRRTILIIGCIWRERKRVIKVNAYEKEINKFYPWPTVTRLSRVMWGRLILSKTLLSFLLTWDWYFVS